jgi:TRAP-type C4-dicarboxylate transport system permease small subunit
MAETKWRLRRRFESTLAVAILLALSVGAVFVAYRGWSAAGDVVMPAWGWLMLWLGVVVTLLLGFGLMALIFYGSRAGSIARLSGTIIRKPSRPR